MQLTSDFLTLTEMEQRASAPAARRPLHLSFLFAASFLVLHIPLALLLKQIPILAVAHGYAILLAGLSFALLSRNFTRLAYILAYLTGAEVLWRMTNTSRLLPWEFSKYAIILLTMAAMARGARFPLHPSPILYFALLVPASAFTLLAQDWGKARETISFELSGPFCVMACLLFLSRVKLDPCQLTRLLIILIGPLAGIAALCYTSTFHNSAITFGKGSNLATSAGFGPNQVAAILGFGIVAGFLCVTSDKIKLPSKLLITAAMLFFAAQSALTFSRTGLYLAAITMTASSFYLVRNPKRLAQLLALASILAIASIYFIYPRLDAFTGGALSRRFKDVNMTGRDKIMAADLSIWAENPILGVGPGLGKVHRARFYKTHSSHTEFTRLLAEHGLLGIAALGFLLHLPIRGFLRASPGRAKGFAASMLLFSFLFMTVSGMRLALPALTLGLAAVVLLSPPPPPPRRKPGSLPAAAPEAPRPCLDVGGGPSIG